MPANDLTEAKLADRIALYRWGPTGFRCNSCGHDRGYRMRTRVRVRQCARCRKTQSVTAGTVMHGTKVSLSVWFARGEYFELGEMPSANSFAKERGIASSTAWHLGQRFMAAVDLGQGEPIDWAGWLLLGGLKCRRPKEVRSREEPKDESSTEPKDDPSKSPEGATSKEARKDAVSKKAEEFRFERTPLLHRLVLGVAGVELVLTDSCPGEETLAKVRKDPLELRAAIHHRGVERWIRAILHVRLGTVCVRWTARYVRHLLLVWNRRSRGDPDPTSWIGQVLAGPHRPLPQLRADAVLA